MSDWWFPLAYLTVVFLAWPWFAVRIYRAENNPRYSLPDDPVDYTEWAFAITIAAIAAMFWPLVILGYWTYTRARRMMKQEQEQEGEDGHVR